MADSRSMYVVYLTDAAVKYHRSNRDATALLLQDEAIKNTIQPLKPDAIIPVVLFNSTDRSDFPRQIAPVNATMPEWDNHYIVENKRIMEALEARYTDTKIDSIPAVLVHANGNRPGGQRIGDGQEESIWKKTNIAYGALDTYPGNDIWQGFGGIYAVLCVSHQRKPFWAIVNSAPNLNDDEIVFRSEDGKPIATTPTDASLFGRPRTSAAITKPEELMRHLVGEVLMQFYMVKSLGSRSFTTGLFGCGMFNGDPEFYAAAVRYVSGLPKFSDIKVAYALGNNYESISGRENYDIFRAPKADKIALAEDVYTRYFKLLCVDSPVVTLSLLSAAVKDYYRNELPNRLRLEQMPAPKTGLLTQLFGRFWRHGNASQQPGQQQPGIPSSRVGRPT